MKAELPFLARSVDLEKLKHLAAEAKDGRGKLILLEGEAGMGKTRIMRELSRLLAEEGMIALTGRCYGRTIPYSPWVEIVYEYSRGLSREHLAKIMAGLPREFSSLDIEPNTPQQADARPAGIRAWLKGPSGNLPSERPATVGSSDGVDRIGFFEGFLRFFTNISQEKPLVLLMDDLHLADSATVQLLRYFAGKILSRRIAIVGAYSDEDVKEADFLSETISDLKKEALCVVLRVEPLTLEETQQFMEAFLSSGTFDRNLAQSVYRVSQGNPFFVQELVASLTHRGGGRQQSSTGLPWMASGQVGLQLPTSLRAIVKKKLVKLPPEAVQALAVASLIGQEFDLELLKETTQANEDALLQHLEAASREGIISETMSSRRVLYRFNHPLMRGELAEELGTARRQKYHRLIAEAIERLQGPTVERSLDLLALHYLESGDEKRALDFSLRAGERASRMLAYDEAIQHLTNAFELCEVPGLRMRISDDIAAYESKRDGWRRFIEEEAFKIGTAGYDTIGEKYERLIVPEFDPIAQHILEWADLKSGQRVLDAGTGTGLLAFMIAPRIGESGHVTGVDISQGMLSVAQRKAREKGLRNLEFKLMDNTNLSFPDGSFDLVVSSFGLPPFNADRAIAEFGRVLKSGGVLAFDEWEPDVPNQPGAIFDETLNKFKTRNPSEKLVMMREAASYRGRGFRRLYDKTALTSWMNKAGFSGIETFKRSHEMRSSSFEDYYEYQTAWWTLDAELQEMPKESKGQFIKSLKDALAPLMNSNGLIERVEINYFKAHKN